MAYAMAYARDGLRYWPARVHSKTVEGDTQDFWGSTAYLKVLVFFGVVSADSHHHQMVGDR